MFSIADILNKLKVKYEDLNAEERQEYKRWDEVMKGEMSVEKITNFLKAEINRIEMEWSIPDLSNERNNYLKAEMRILKTLLAFIESPERSKEFLEQHLSTLFKK